MTITSLLMGATSVLLMALSVPLWMRTVPPNSLYGFRVPQTLNDRELWYEVNAKTGFDLFVVSAVLLALSMAHFAGQLREIPYLLLATGVLVLGTFVSAAHGFAIIGRNPKPAGAPPVHDDQAGRNQPKTQETPPAGHL